MDISLFRKFSEIFSLAPISDEDVCQAIRRLTFSKSLGLDYSPGFVIEGYSVIFILILTRIFNFRLT
jgi:hypothetical protein